MNPFKRKSRTEKLIDSLRSNDALKSAAIVAAESAVAGATSRRQAEKIGKAIESFDGKSSGGIKSKAKSGLLVAAGTAAVLAASASISSHRRQEENQAA